MWPTAPKLNCSSETAKARFKQDFAVVASLLGEWPLPWLVNERAFFFYSKKVLPPRPG